RIAFQPTSGTSVFLGTLRIENAGMSMTASGDLYRFLSQSPGTGLPPASPPVMEAIPVFPRARYHSYLAVTAVQKSPPMTTGPCQATLPFQQYLYSQPSSGESDGPFAASPSRTVSAVLSPQMPPPGFLGSYFSGRLFEGAADKGAFTLGWVSPFFRRATVE